MSVRISGACKTFGDHPAVDGVDLDATQGEFVVVLGPSGCGKSTLLRLIAGLETLDSGEIALGADTVSGPGRHVPPEDRSVGVVFQSYALWPHMSVRDNVAFPLESAGQRRGAAREGATAHLETVDLSALAERKPSELSGGQRQRVALARCLAGGARTVLMDEPLANLDPHLRGRMEAEIAEFHRKTGVTSIYITHDQREAMALADRIAVMSEGRFLQVAPPQEIHDRPATAEVARFIGQAAVVPATLRHEAGWHADLGPLRVPVTAPEGLNGGAGQIVLRATDLTLGTGPLSGRIDAAFYRGGGWEGRVSVDGIADPLPVASRRRMTAGEQVALSLHGGWALP
ncbi:carbohydrate ABC transporter ATP-binding protein, CUT1 family [Tranquillimonas rosea]|uniref:Carbohydrate ABC transporter ATP-binding protein, CUT1 family n=1 Tax=Tranquillimonas rosea TaxID=641238 RepID=A0A1H9RMQ1_9RHOB|nr:ABC transporter ATP-binding protein [Tranquillimonas rosea]SER73189.1 carbohydrate ABC transporter ATP-binding protein, CUT1 family [Tranquillimonas rosea]